MSVHEQLPNPSYVPPGFVHRLDAYGADTAAFGFDSEQVARIFTRDLSSESWNRPLVIAWVPRAGAVLAATENRTGTPVPLPNGTGVYHDGLWQFGVGPDQVDVPALLPSQPHRISISRWRVPRAWGASGRFRFGLLFGFALGSGVLTATPSVGFIVLLGWLLSTSTGVGVLVMLAFALARALPALAITADPRGLSERSRGVDRIAELSGRWTVPERVALIAFAVSVLATSS